MSDHPIIQNSQYDTPFNLWHRFLEADLGVGWSDDDSLDIVTVLDETPLFDGVNLRDQEILGLVACLFYSSDDLQFPPDVNLEYNAHIWKICQAIKARPSLVFTHLTLLFTEMINDSKRILECAIILKVLHDTLNNLDDSVDISTYVLCLAIDTLRDVVDSGWGMDDVEKVIAKQVSRLIAELRYRTIPKGRAIAWPRNYSSNQPVGGWFMVSLDTQV